MVRWVGWLLPALVVAPSRGPRYWRRPARADSPTSEWACLHAADFECPGVDELPRDFGCQVSCGGTADCSRAKEKCAALPGCSHHTVNGEHTWATLKLPRLRGAKGKGARGGESPAEIWCAPPLWVRHEQPCTEKDPLCVVVARTSDSELFTARLETDVPASTPVVVGRRAFYPPGRHAAATHLTFIYEAYEHLPKALALTIDYGDKHAESGCNVCAQALQLRAIAALSPGLLSNPRLFKSLAPHQPRDGLRDPSPANFSCARHALSAAEKDVWRAVLSPVLGAPPAYTEAYEGGQLLVSRAKLRQLPLSRWAALLRLVLSHSAAGDAAASLLPHVWGALLGEPFGAGEVAANGSEPSAGEAYAGWRRGRRSLRRGGRRAFTCDSAGGWGGGGGVLPLEPTRLSLAAEADGARAPATPSRRERAAGCGAAQVACAVVAVHKESLGWLQELQMPTLVYRRYVHDGPYVVPNVFHEHAVYLRYICAFYDELPALSLFIHGHRASWHHRETPPVASQLQRINLKAAAAAGGVFKSFNDVRQCWRDGEAMWRAETAAQVHGWARSLRPILGNPPDPPIIREAYCCTQFIVSRDRIRARPHSFWRALLADLLDERVPEVCKISGHTLEMMWAYLLGEPADFKCREDGWGAEGEKGAL
ncbi:hypothetical protein AB1Y20_015053 [Prymnesium parvum]|uniref:Uncharacterized protein n=1 Tax=Prymnesium parvum TaxID=97485 RepID=A0AB34JXB8_PRYPA